MSETTQTPPAPETWAIVELMGHVSLAGRVTKPGEYGGLWQIDVPDGVDWHTEFFGSQSVYRIRIVSEAIARFHVQPAGGVIEYDAPIITRAEHQEAMERANRQYGRLVAENEELRRRLTAVNAPPALASGASVPAPAAVDDEDDGR